MKSRTLSSITVKKAPFGTVHDGLLTAGHLTYRCKMGKSGIRTRKFEGDGATPAGNFAIIGGFLRRDRWNFMKPVVAGTEIRPDTGWCDDPRHSCYNRMVGLPFAFSHENMFRKDNLYDVCLVLDYNYFCRKRHAGSAIFFHLANPLGTPTLGCIGLERSAMMKLLPRLSHKTRITVIA